MSLFNYSNDAEIPKLSIQGISKYASAAQSADVDEAIKKQDLRDRLHPFTSDFGRHGTIGCQ